MKSKKIVMSSIIATALLGAGVFAGSITDINNINEHAGNNKVLFGNKDERGTPPVERQGVYSEWVAYGLQVPLQTSSSGTKYLMKPVFLNYKLNTPKAAGDPQEYILGIVFPEFKSTSYVNTIDTKAQVENFLNNPDYIRMNFMDIDRIPDEGYDPSGFESSPTDLNSEYVKIQLDDTTMGGVIPIESEEDWPFDLTAVDLYGAYDSPPATPPTTFQPWQHFAYSIPLNDDEFDHLFGQHENDTEAFYQWNSSAHIYTVDSMNVESNLSVRSIILYPKDQTTYKSITITPLYSYKYDDWSGASDGGSFTSVNDDRANGILADRLSERDKSLWLKYPEPTISVLNAKKNADGVLVVEDGSFGDGYTLDIEYAHNVTDEKFSIVHGFDYKLFGPGIKGDGRDDVLWDHWWVDDSGIYRQFRTNPEDPNELSKVFTIATNGVDVNPWLDGTNEIGVTVNNPDLLDDVDQKDGKGDINIGLVDPVDFSPADPDFATGKNKGETYSTGYLYSESPYNATIDVDGIHTDLGYNNSFQWPSKKMSLKIGVTTDVYEPWKPEVTKFEFITDPLHDETGEIKNSWSYSMDAKTDAEFDGTSYYPSKIEYVQIVSPDGATVYSDMIATTPYEETGTGEIEGTFESGNLPANQTDLPLALKVYYGNGVGNEPETAANGEKYWTEIVDNGITVNTGVRGSADYTTSMNLTSQDSTSAVLNISVNPVKTIGTEASVDHWGEDLSTYETSNIKSGTISIIGDAPADITDEDMTTWDAGTVWENKTEWTLTPEQISELNSAGTTSVSINGLLPNTDYQVETTFIYEGETKPSYADDRWDASWEEDRTVTTNPVDIHTNDTVAAKPENITLSYEIVSADAETRSAIYKYKLTADISGTSNTSDIYAPTNVTKVTFTSTNHDVHVIDQAAEDSSPTQITWDVDEVNGKLTASYQSTTRGMIAIDDTVSATITYAGGEVSTFDAVGGEGGPLEASIHIPDRGNLEVKAAEPTEVSSTNNSITFSGTFDEIVPNGANLGTSGGGTDAIDETQFTKNKNFKVDIVDDKGNVLASTEEVTPVTSKSSAGSTVDQYQYEVTAEGLNPNKQYNVHAVVSYEGTSKVNDEGELAGQYPDVNKVRTIESANIAIPGTTDTLGYQDPSIIEMSDVEIILDETTRDITAKGQFKLDVVSKDEEAGYASDYSATDVTAIRIMDGDKAVFTLTDTSIINSQSNSEITVDWTINSADIAAKTDYDLAIEVDWAEGTKVFNSQHITFNSGSRGDLTYGDVTLREVSNSAGPLLNMEYNIEYTGNNGYDYADFNLLKVNSVKLKAKYVQDVMFNEDGSLDDPSGDWNSLADPLWEAAPYTYNGEPKQFSLGYNELINELPRYPGAPKDDSVDPADDWNGNGIYDDAYIYEFRIEVDAEFDGKPVKTSDPVRYDQFAFLKGGFTPVVREFELSDIEVDEETSIGKVAGSFWIEHRPENYYDGMIGDDYKYHNEMDMWESGVQSINLYNVTDPERTDFTTADPYDQVLWTLDEGIPEFFDQPDSYNDTPVVDASGVEDRVAYDAWLAEDHTKKEFEIDNLTPGQTYKFRLVTHYSGDDLTQSHTEFVEGDGGVVSPEGYDIVNEFEFDVPLAGVEEILLEDVEYGAAKSSLTSWTLSYQVKNNVVDPTKENFKLDEVRLLDADGEVLAQSEESMGQLVATNLMPGTNPIQSGWTISITTEDEQELIIDLDQDWLESSVDMDGNALYVDNGDGTYDWSKSESDAIESWDVKVPEDGFINVSGDATNITQTSFDLTLDVSDELANLMLYEAVDPSSLKIIDVATGEQLETTLLTKEVFGRSTLEDFSGTHTVQITGLQPGTVYGAEGFDIIFNVHDQYAPVPAGEEATDVEVTFATTEANEIRTLDTPTSSWIWILIVILILLIVGIVLVVLWFIMLAWRKEKETDFKPGEVTFQLNKSYASDAKKLDGAKLKSSMGELNYSISKATNGKILVTVTGITKKEPIKGLKFALDNRSVKAENAKIEESNKALTTKFEADLKAWEDKKAKTPEGVTFSDPKPAKPTLAKKGKVAKDITIIGAVKTVKPAPKEAKPKTNAPKAGSGTARKIS